MGIGLYRKALSKNETFVGFFFGSGKPLLYANGLKTAQKEGRFDEKALFRYSVLKTYNC